MEMTPINNKVIAEHYKINASDSGIVLANSPSMQNCAKIRATGPGVSQVAVGDLVLFGQYLEFPFFGEKLITFAEHDIICKLTGEPPKTVVSPQVVISK